MKRICFAIAALFAALMLQGQNLVILHTNDTHSHIEPVRSGEDAGKGGVIERAAYVDSVRAAAGPGRVLLMDAGDFSQGTSYFTLMDGDVEVNVMNAMKYDVACLGNHEFDNGLEELARRVRALDFPVVCANYKFSGNGLDTLIRPYAILHRGGMKIGVIGLLTDLTVVVDREIADRIEYLDPVEVTDRYARLLKEDKSCDMVICLTHIGYDSDVELAARTHNVDMIIGGHSHTFLEEAEVIKNPDGKDVTVVTDGCWGLYVGKAEIYSDEILRKNRISSKYDIMDADTLIKAGGDWFPYPDYTDRDAWTALFGDSAEAVIAAAEEMADYRWQIIPASAYLAYERTGERKIMENPFDANRRALNVFMLAELAEGKGRFIDQIVDGLWMSCQMTSWVLSAHNPRQSTKRSLPDPRQYIIDLGSGGYGALISVAYHFFHDEIEKIDPSVNYCVETAVKERILDPFFDESVRKANWWMSEGWKPGQTINNWNPWCNSNVLLCFLLMEKDQKRLSEAVRLSAESVDRFLDFVKSDGACEEGPAYWGHAAGKLYDYLQMLHDASGGKLSFFDDEMVRRMGEYISRSYIGSGWVVNFADATASMTPDITLTYRYGKALGSREMQNFAIYLLYSAKSGAFRDPQIPLGNDGYRSLESVRWYDAMKHDRDSLQHMLETGSAAAALSALRASVPTATWYPETEFCYLRNSSDWFFAGKGGFNNESHNHNDVGTFILYVNDIPVFVDAGVGTYTKKTFSSERYTIWSMQSDYHNLPAINGMPQHEGLDYRASDVSCNLKARTFSADISGAYVEEAGCRSWVRSYQLKDDSLVIKDRFNLDGRTGADRENFIVHGKVALPGETYTVNGRQETVKPGCLAVSASDDVVMLMKYPASFRPSVEEISLDDPRLTNVWGKSLWRITLTSPETAPVKGTYEFVVKRAK